MTMTQTRAGTKTDMLYMSIAEAGAAIKAGTLSPVDLTKAVLERIKATNPMTNSYVLVLEESALAEAAASEARQQAGTLLGPLDGIPMGIKDLYDVAGYVTTNGTGAHRFRVPTVDSTPVARLRAAGAVIVGKTNTHELAMGGTTNNKHYGPTHNPWNLDRIPGGSSGGSGSALAAGEALGALGTDTGGSIRGPASYCGISGIKPTYGLSSRGGVGALSHTLDHTGPMARTVLDCALMLNALQGYDPADLDSVDHPTEDFTAGIDGGIAGMTFAVIPSLVAISTPDVKAAFEASLAKLESLGAKIVNLEPLAGIDDYRGLVQNISAVETNDYNEAIVNQDPPVIAEVIRKRLVMGRAVPAYLYSRMLDNRKMLEQRMQDGLLKNGYDAYLLPSTPMTAFPIDPDPDRDETPGRMRGGITSIFNIAHQPSISIPNGFDPDGLPTGLLISGAQWTDAKVMRIAHAYQMATDFHTKRPPLFA